MSRPTPHPPQPHDGAAKPRQGRVHFNPALARPKPLPTIPHGTQTLLALDHRRFLTARQISRLYYRGDAEAIVDPERRALALAAADRQVNRCTLRPLKDAGLITVVRPFILGETTPLARKEVVVLTAKGAAVVKQLYDDAGRGQTLRWRRDWLAIDNTNQAHAALLSDWYILLRRAMDGNGWQLAGWRDDRDLAQLTAQGQTQLAGLIPDAAFVLAHARPDGRQTQLPVLLEIDLGSEMIVGAQRPARDWTAKIERYRRYFATTYPTDPLWTGITTPPLVATLTTTPGRLAHVLAATRAAGGDARFWFGTIALLRGDRDPVTAFWQSSWQRPGDEPVTLAAAAAAMASYTVS